MSARATTIQTQAPLVLLVDADEVLLEQCQQAALEMGFRIKSVNMSSMPSIASSRQPFAIATTTEVYRGSALELHMVAERVQARLICVSPRAKCELLKLMLRSARQASTGEPTAS